MQCKSIKRSYKCVYTAKQKLSLPFSRCSKLDAQTCRRFLVAMSVTVHGSVCSFCVRLCGWTRSLCLSALPSDRAPDEVIRTVTGVARLHCLYLAGVSVVRFCGALSDRFYSCGVLTLCVSLPGPEAVLAWSRFSISLKGEDWTVFSARAGDSALPGLLHLHCR